MIHYAAQKGRTKISCRQRTVFRIRILLLENHSGYVASVLQLPAYLTTYHTPGRHGRAPAEYVRFSLHLVNLFTGSIGPAVHGPGKRCMALSFAMGPYSS